MHEWEYYCAFEGCWACCCLTSLVYAWLGILGGYEVNDRLWWLWESVYTPFVWSAELGFLAFDINIKTTDCIHNVSKMSHLGPRIGM